jgi:class 3 adenylate cyclase/tetratricopeptide (TPR) repeat protein
LFCDLVGSTEIAVSLDPEEWRDIAAQYQRTAAAAVERFDGDVAKFLGDGLVCFFGWPHAHDNDAERAVRAGLAIVEAVRHLALPKSSAEMQTPVASTPTQRDLRLHVRVGIHTGPVVIGQGGADEAEVFGDTPNLAARVQTAADPDTVLMTAATHHLVSGLFVVDEPRERMLKGFSEPVTLYRARQASGVRGRIHAAAAQHGLTPFVGREHERQLLLDRWERAEEREGQVILITGEAGIGKSRLVQQFKAEIGVTPHTWVEAAASPYLQHTPFAFVSDMLRQGFQFPADLQMVQRVEAVEGALEALDLSPAETMPIVAPLLSLELPDKYPPLDLTPEERRRRLLQAMINWTLASARLQPLVQVLEDLHWMDASSLELLALIAQQAATAPILVLCTARPEFRPSWPQRSHQTQVTLSRLDQRQTRAMLAAMAMRVTEKTELMEGLVARTDGVPLFVEELALAMLEGQTTAPREIPATLQDTLMARLDRLGPLKEVAQVGAVLGRDFSFSSLAALLEWPAAKLESALRHLCDAELLYVRGLGAAASYTFKHALIQEAAYESLLKTRRRELHERAAASMAADPNTPPAVLAQHWERAGATERAIAAWQAGAEAGQRSAAISEAEAHYLRAIELTAALPDEGGRRDRELNLQIALASLLSITRGPALAGCQRALDRAVVLAEQGDPTQAVALLAALWNSSMISARSGAAFAIAEKMIAVAERDGSARSLVIAHTSAALNLLRLGRLDTAPAHLERALAVYEEEDFANFPISFAVLAAGAWIELDSVVGANAALQAHTAFLSEAADRRHNPLDSMLAELYSFLGAAIRREPEGLGERTRAVITTCTEQHLDMFLAHAQILTGWVMASEGQVEAGIELLREGVRRERTDGNVTALAVHLSLLAEAYLANGDIDAATHAVDEAFAAIRDEELWRSDLLRLRGDVLVAQAGALPGVGDQAADAERGKLLKSAEECYRSAVDQAARIGAKVFETRAATTLADLLRQQGSEGKGDG